MKHVVAYALIAAAVAGLTALAQQIGAGSVHVPAEYQPLLPVASAVLVSLTVTLKQLVGAPEQTS